MTTIVPIIARQVNTRPRFLSECVLCNMSADFYSFCTVQINIKTSENNLSTIPESNTNNKALTDTVGKLLTSLRHATSTVKIHNKRLDPFQVEFLQPVPGPCPDFLPTLRTAHHHFWHLDPACSAIVLDEVVDPPSWWREELAIHLEYRQRKGFL